MLSYEKYNKDRLSVKGDKDTYQNFIKKLGGRWNSRMKGGEPGWLVPINQEQNLKLFIDKLHLKEQALLQIEQHSKEHALEHRKYHREVSCEEGRSSNSEYSDSDKEFEIDPLVRDLLVQQNSLKTNQQVTHKMHDDLLLLDAEKEESLDNLVLLDNKSLHDYNENIIDLPEVEQENLEERKSLIENPKPEVDLENQKNTPSAEYSPIRREHHRDRHRDRHEQHREPRDHQEHHREPRDHQEHHREPRDHQEHHREPRDHQEQHREPRDHQEQHREPRDHHEQHREHKEPRDHREQHREHRDHQEQHREPRDRHEPRERQQEDESNSRKYLKQQILHLQREKDLKRHNYSQIPKADVRQEQLAQNPMGYYKDFSKKPVNFKELYASSDNFSSSDEDEDSSSSDDFPSPNTPKNISQRNNNHTDLFQQVKELQKRLHEMETKNSRKH